MIGYPKQKLENQREEIQQRYKILGSTDGILTSPIAQTAALVFDVPMVIVALTERYRHWFKVSFGMDDKTHALLQDFCATAALCDTSFQVEDAAAEPYFLNAPAVSGRPGVRFYAGAPLRNPMGQRFGTLCILDTAARKMSPKHQQLLESFAGVVSEEICVRSAARYAVRDLIDLEEDKSSLYDLATTDPLTSALNRRAYFHFAEREVRRANRHGLNLTGVMLDIDHFKKVNDVHGHAAGDEVLKRISEFVLKSIRDEDFFGRIGGEEFSLLLPETDPQNAMILCNRLRRGIKSMEFIGESGSFSVTMSMGMSNPEFGDTTIEPCLERADRHLYTAKNTGRDRVIGPATPAPKDSSTPVQRPGTANTQITVQ